MCGPIATLKFPSRFELSLVNKSNRRVLSNLYGSTAPVIELLKFCVVHGFIAILVVVLSVSTTLRNGSQ